MRSGDLKDRVSILKKSTSPDSMGYEVETWTTTADVWGELRQEKGSEILQNDRPIAFRRAIVFIRYRADVSVQNRVKVRGTTYEIESIRTLEAGRRNEGLELVVRSND
jgi:SPP1 family predicted phage head-tail adaptor